MKTSNMGRQLPSCPQGSSILSSNQSADPQSGCETFKCFYSSALGNGTVAYPFICPPYSFLCHYLWPLTLLIVLFVMWLIWDLKLMLLLNTHKHTQHHHHLYDYLPNRRRTYKFIHTSILVQSHLFNAVRGRSQRMESLQKRKKTHCMYERQKSGVW